MLMDITIPYYEDNTRISRSSLKWFEQSPRYYRDMLDGKEEGIKGRSIDKGIMTHIYLLQQEEFKKSYKILDFETPSSQQQKKFCQDYVNSTAEKPILRALEAFKNNYSTNGKKDEESAAKGLEMALKLKQYIKFLRSEANSVKTMTWSDLNSLKLTKENVILHKKANELLYSNDNEWEGYNEFHINWEYRVDSGTVYKCKSLLDRFRINKTSKTIQLIDIKTTISTSEFHKSYRDYDYAMQMSFYWMAIFWYMKNILEIDLSDWNFETYIIAIKNTSPFDCRVFSVSDESMNNEIDRISDIMNRIDWHTTNDLWDYRREYYENDGVEELP